LPALCFCKSKPSGRAQQLAAGGTISQIWRWKEAAAVKLRHTIAFDDEARDPDGVDLADDATERRRKSPAEDRSDICIARANYIHGESA
jgi:hypothetical protein